MLPIVYGFQNPDSPAWLPPAEEISRMSIENGSGPSNFIIHEPGGSNTAFVKYGGFLPMSEARTQHHIATIVNADENPVVRVPTVYYAFQHTKKNHIIVGHIVMEHVGDRDCTTDDFPEIAAAVERLQLIPSPTKAPGPVGGGAIGHRFFAECFSSVRYDSVKLLEDHINNILARQTYTERVKFDSDDLFICLDDLHWGNFRKNESTGLIYSIDHARTNFLPLPFRQFTFAERHVVLANKFHTPLTTAESRLCGDVMLASAVLHLYNNNSFALPRFLRESQAIDSTDLLK